MSRVRSFSTCTFSYVLRTAAAITAHPPKVYATTRIICRVFCLFVDLLMLITILKVEHSIVAEQSVSLMRHIFSTLNSGESVVLNRKKPMLNVATLSCTSCRWNQAEKGRKTEGKTHATSAPVIVGATRSSTPMGKTELVKQTFLSAPSFVDTSQYTLTYILWCTI
jgi:hypothetical protein